MDDEAPPAPQERGRSRQQPRQKQRGERPGRERRPKADPFAPQVAEAASRRSAAAERARRREEAAAAKRAAGVERERVQKLVARARKPGRDGRRRLGRESAVLLDKVKKLVGSG
jgi:hypothetical protein